MKRTGPGSLQKRRLSGKTSAARVVGKLVRALKKGHDPRQFKNQSLQQTRRELMISRKEYEQSYDVAPASFVTFTVQGLIQEMNLPAARLLNHDRERMLGLPFVRFIAKNDRKKFLDHLSGCGHDSEQCHPASIELQLARKTGGSPVFIELFTIPVVERPSGQTMYKSVFRDITPLKQMQGSIAGWRQLSNLPKTPSSELT